MAYFADDDPGIPLSHYREHEGAGVLLICRRCTYDRSIDLEPLIERLNARGLDGPNVGVNEVARYTLGNCPECRARSWETRPDFRSRPGQDGLPLDFKRRR